MSTEETPPPSGRVPLGIVVARILVISGLGFSAALGLFLLIGGIWQVGLAAFAVTAVLLAAMFLIERWAT